MRISELYSNNRGRFRSSLVFTVVFMLFIRLYFQSDIKGKTQFSGTAKHAQRSVEPTRRTTQNNSIRNEHYSHDNHGKGSKEDLSDKQTEQSKKAKEKKMQNINEICALYRAAKRVPHTAFTNVWPVVPEKIASEDVTLVMQCSLDRATAFSQILERWPGPVSAAIYLQNGSAPSSAPSSLEPFLDFPWSKKRNNVFLHSVKDEAVFYPVNYLRNLALNNSKTYLSFLLDCDFLPSMNLYEHLKSLVKKWPIDKLALVIPAFQYLQNNTMEFPGNKRELISEWAKERLQPFHDINGFHHATNFTYWKTAKERYKISEWQDSFEPYVVVKTEGLPQYDERFVGRLRDKMSYLHHLHALRFDYQVDPQHFVLHIPHPIHDYKKIGNYYQCAENLYRSFQQAVNSKNSRNR